MDTKVIVDPGSCHMAKIEYCKEFIDLATQAGCWAIKFQLFKDLPPNIELPRHFWPELVNYAKDRIIIFASCFDVEAMRLMQKYQIRYTKYAYSLRHIVRNQKFSTEALKVFVSCPPSEANDYPNCIKLFCIPHYPVCYRISFDELFKRYPLDGFSDHTLGYRQTLEAVRHGAKYIEKHITLDHDDIECPDNSFALRPEELKEMMSEIKNI